MGSIVKVIPGTSSVSRVGSSKWGTIRPEWNEVLIPCPVKSRTTP